MQLVLYPDQILLTPSKAIRVLIDRPNLEERSSLAAEMWKIMEENGGVGLAAPQVGFNIRMFVWRHYRKNEAIWNPVICSVSGINSAPERCLSLPGVTVSMERSSTSRLIGTGINGEKLSFWGNDHNTRIWQHEISHLDGRLIIDSMSKSEESSNHHALTILKLKYNAF